MWKTVKETRANQLSPSVFGFVSERSSQYISGFLPLISRAVADRLPSTRSPDLSASFPLKKEEEAEIEADFFFLLISPPGTNHLVHCCVDFPSGINKVFINQLARTQFLFLLFLALHFVRLL